MAKLIELTINKNATIQSLLQQFAKKKPVAEEKEAAEIELKIKWNQAVDDEDSSGPTLFRELLGKLQAQDSGVKITAIIISEAGVAVAHLFQNSTLNASVSFPHTNCLTFENLQCKFPDNQTTDLGQWLSDTSKFPLLNKVIIFSAQQSPIDEALSKALRQAITSSRIAVSYVLASNKRKTAQERTPTSNKRMLPLSLSVPVAAPSLQLPRPVKLMPTPVSGSSAFHPPVASNTEILALLSSPARSPIATLAAGPSPRPTVPPSTQVASPQFQVPPLRLPAQVQRPPLHPPIPFTDVTSPITLHTIFHSVGVMRNSMGSLLTQIDDMRNKIDNMGGRLARIEGAVHEITKSLHDSSRMKLTLSQQREHQQQLLLQQQRWQSSSNFSPPLSSSSTGNGLGLARAPALFSSLQPLQSAQEDAATNGLSRTSTNK